jgi:hypothetical protein
VRIGFRVLLAEGHRAEADAGDVQAGAAEWVDFHEKILQAVVSPTLVDRR